MSPANAAVGREIRAARSRHDLTQRELADATGLATETVNRLEKNRRDITVSYLDVICRILGMTPSELVADAERHSPGAFRRSEARIVGGGSVEPSAEPTASDPRSPRPSDDDHDLRRGP